LLFELYGADPHTTPTWNIKDKEVKEAFLFQWVNACQLPTNKALILLDRVEGGLCSKDGVKELRYLFSNDNASYFDYEWYFRAGTWTLEEMLDLKNAFILVMENQLQGPHCRGRLMFE
jgi:hypothetical protein